MTDNWKGEGLIRGIRPTTNQKKAEAARIGSNLSNEARRRAGIPCVAANGRFNHAAFYRAALIHKGK